MGVLFHKKNGFERGYLNRNEPAALMFARIFDAVSGAVLFSFLMVILEENPPPFTHRISAVIFLFTVLVFHYQRIYRSFRFSSLQVEIYTLFFAVLNVTILLFIVGFIIGILPSLPRLPVILWMVFWPLSIALMRSGSRKFLRSLRKKGFNLKRAVIAGTGDTGRTLVRHIRENAWTGTEVVAFFHTDPNKTDGSIENVPVAGGLDNLVDYVNKNHIDIVYIALNGNRDGILPGLIQALENTTVAVHYVPNIYFLDLISGGDIVFFNNRPIIVLNDSPIGGIASILKRLMDIVVAGAGILVFAPVMAVIALAVKISSPGPVLFVQPRFGINGKPINIYKFRTMYHQPEPETGAFQQATRNDPRVTPLGQLLRKTSLDELPQLFNILQGRMSLVGPRPHPVAMNEHYRNLISGYMIRHKVRPGLTGLAQVRGFRGETDTFEKMEKRIEYDLTYIREWSLMLDLEILARTFVVFLFQKNAY